MSVSLAIVGNGITHSASEVGYKITAPNSDVCFYGYYSILSIITIIEQYTFLIHIFYLINCIQLIFFSLFSGCIVLEVHQNISLMILLTFYYITIKKFKIYFLIILYLKLMNYF